VWGGGFLKKDNQRIKRTKRKTGRKQTRKKRNSHWNKYHITAKRPFSLKKKEEKKGASSVASQNKIRSLTP